MRVGNERRIDNKRREVYMEGRCIVHGKIYTQKEVYMKGQCIYIENHTQGDIHTQ